MSHPFNDYEPRGERPTAEDKRYALELLHARGPVRAAKHVGTTKTTLFAVALGLIVHRGSLLAIRDARQRDQQQAA